MKSNFVEIDERERVSTDVKEDCVTIDNILSNQTKLELARVVDEGVPSHTRGTCPRFD